MRPEVNLVPQSAAYLFMFLWEVYNLSLNFFIFFNDINDLSGSFFISK